jgi:hypothetical protein
MIVKCSYCGQQAKLTRARDLPSSVVGFASWARTNNAFVWYCDRCDAWVVARRNLKPLGKLANKKLREKRYKLHQRFDELWKRGYLERNEAYRLLAKEIGIKPERCHIGNFSEGQCQRAEEALNGIEKRLIKH